ncbi:hypothetical protein [uncultured Muribaculum sp.]|nr:hypothetical protein [uncultured Muribaculum sp.]
MQRYNRLLHTFLVSVLLALGMTACVDDDLIFRQGGEYPHGEAVVNIEAAFSPFSAAAMGSRAYEYAPTNGYTTAGNLMGDISDVALLIYDKDGNLLKDDGLINLTDYVIKDEPRVEGDAGKDDNVNRPLGEPSTKCLTKKGLKLFFGEYYLIAVANMGQYTKNGDKLTIAKSTYQTFSEMDVEDYNTLHKLRRMRRQWAASNINNNREMCGYFAVKGEDSSPTASSDFQTVVVNESGMTLRTWLRRLASKVTVDFDGTGLRENVKVYIRNVTIHDIATSCTLGFGKHKDNDIDPWIDYNNHVGSDDDAADGSHSTMGDHTHSTGGDNTSHAINFFNMYDKTAVAGNGGDAETNHEKWPRIAKGSPYIYMDPKADVKERRDLHALDAPALFFYENMQGDLPDGKTKGPMLDISSGGATDNGDKDGMEYGTYIEVSAYYESEASGNISNGPIKYRFMLGKDAIRNCDAERNYHYKVTLKFNGNANDVSWHIDYVEEPDSWDVPQPWYVSYLYNHQSTIPFKYTPKEGYEVVYFEAEITKNPWEPDKDEGIPLPPDNDQAIAADENKQIGNGFLSLRQTTSLIITPKDCGVNAWTGYDNAAEAKRDTSIHMNNQYFLGISDGSGGLNRAKRRFNVSKDAQWNDSKDDYVSRPKEEFSYQRNERNQSVSLDMPLFTRAKTLIKQTGYSGNNPYVGYTRTATIKVTPFVRKKNTTDKPAAATPRDIQVEQVRRIVNPKGVYRRSGNNQDFAVHLLELPGDLSTTFRDFTSDGPWMAEILGDKNFITLDGKQTVTGSTGSSIAFNIRFNKLNSADETVRNAVVRVRYNSYTCTHLIFVRQGYNPQAISKNAKDFDHKGGTATAVKWRTFNRIAARLDAKDPRDEGSLFKHGNVWNAIDSYNNCYKDMAADGKRDGMGIYTAPSLSEFTSDVASNGKYKLTEGDGRLSDSEKDWTSFNKNNSGFTSTDPDWSSMATMRHFEQLYATNNIQFGFGVLYADGATSTQWDISSAYGYYRRDPENTGPVGPDPDFQTDSPKGMRGMFAYYYDETDPGNECTGNSVFFPIGRSGYGHRKDMREAEGNTKKGVLRYSCAGYENRGWLFNKTAPLFSALYYRPGAVYYAKDAATDNFLDWTGAVGNSGADGKAIGMDINYFSFDVNMIGAVNVAEGEDACMVRFVE